MIYEIIDTIPSMACDANDHLSLWGAARLFQDVADLHTQVTHIGFNDLIASNKAWVLSRMYYRYHRLPAMGEKVTLKTWSRGTNGLFAFRDWQMLDNNNLVIVDATADWVMIDFDSRHVCRIHEYMSDYEHHNICATDRDHFEKLKMPSFDGIIPKMLDVRESMIDHTQHVNNAEYIRWISDYQNPQFSTKRLKSLEIIFAKETQRNETISVYSISDSDSTLFQITNSRDVAVKAQLRYE